MLSVVIGLSGAIYIWAATRGIRPLVLLLKPGTMLLILLLAAQGTAIATATGYSSLVLVGLLCSLAGDIFLMLKRERFVAGLAAFLLAHLCYIGALVAVGAARPTLLGALVIILLAVIGRLVYRKLAEGIIERGEERLLGPVAIYIGAISLMVGLAANGLVTPDATGPHPGLAAAGALLFYLSDGALAWDRFMRPLPWRHLIIMGCYFAAQLCFARSVG